MFKEPFKFPCAGHRLNLCVSDLFKLKKIYEKENSFSVFEINNNEELRKKTIGFLEKEKIEEVNEAKTDILSLMSKCRRLVSSFRHSEQLFRRLKENQQELNLPQKNSFDPVSYNPLEQLV